MCGRFAQGDIDAIYKKYKITINDKLLQKIKPRYNIAPAQIVPIVYRDEKGNSHIEQMKWGLVPFWAKDPSIGYKFINARSESIATKPTFRKAFLHQRCIVPASGFYEWFRAGRNKIPYFMYPKNEELFSLAAIYDIWIDTESRKLRSFAILTTDSNKLIEKIHNRMPVILEKDEEKIWLNPKIKDKDALEPLFDPYPAKEMGEHLVSKNVNSTRNESPDLIKPTK